MMRPRVPRRSHLILLVCILALTDLVFLGWRWHRDTAPNAEVTWIGFDSTRMIVETDTPSLSLRAGRWYLGVQPIADVAAYAKGLAAEGHMPVVSAPDYRALVPVHRGSRPGRSATS